MVSLGFTPFRFAFDEVEFGIDQLLSILIAWLLAILDF